MAEFSAPTGWIKDEAGLHRTLTFRNFADAWAFMNRVAVLAEEQDHHPDWKNSYNTVHITLISHDKRAVTARDIRLATAINDIVE